jgi:hypothetical protein
MITHDLDLRLEYTALSYTWGDPMPKHSILINGKRHRVPQNLFDFMQAYVTHSWGLTADVPFRGFKYTGQFWIDQICIDQSNASERSAQVSIMGNIFKTAEKVLVWLGCDAIMVEAARKVRDRAPDQYSALRTLLGHAYFSRLWIVQEVALAAKISIACGDVKLEWAELRTTLESALQLITTLPEWSWKPPTHASAVFLGYEPTHTLERCISLYCANECQDRRDKVYGLLGLTSERWRVKVDYTKIVVDVYLDAVMAMCEELRDILDPACFYPEDRRASARAAYYRATLLTLGKEMGLSPHQLRGLGPFIGGIQAVLSITNIRNVRYQYNGRILRAPYLHADTQDTEGALQRLSEMETADVGSDEFDDQDLYGEWEWASITATRRNPVVRDVIPRMGLQLAVGSAQDILKQQDNEIGPVCDRWWIEYNGKVHYCAGISRKPESSVENRE